jgi:hypothetical protein
MILDVTGGLTKLHNELHNLYSAPNITSMTKSRKMRWVGHLVCVGGMTNAFKILVQNLQTQRSLRRPMHRQEEKY